MADFIALYQRPSGDLEYEVPVVAWENRVAMVCIPRMASLVPAGGPDAQKEWGNFISLREDRDIPNALQTIAAGLRRMA